MTQTVEAKAITIPAANIVDPDQFEAARRSVYKHGHESDDLLALTQEAELSIGGIHQSLYDTARLGVMDNAAEDESPAAVQRREALQRLQAAAESSEKGTFYSLIFDDKERLTDVMRVSKMPVDQDVLRHQKRVAKSIGYGPKSNGSAFVNPRAVPKH